uniref:Ribosome-recycling factor n=1 Tax=Anaerolinea thermolimosa TaxID=229919 RepID=A0A7C4PKU7_9CHLR
MQAKGERNVMSDIMTTVKSRMQEVIDHVKEEFAGIRTGRANAALVDSIPVQYYGNTTPIKQMASITIPEPTVIVVQPWDKQSVGDVEQAIRNSSLGLSPINEGTQLRIVLPALTTERREQLIKTLHEKAEAGKVALRTIRKEVWDDVQKQVKSGDLTEDDKYRYEEDLNKVIDSFNREIDQLESAKENEIRTV